MTEVRRNAIRIGLVVWLCAVLAFFFWETFAYRGLIARVGEWQFGDLGGYFPNFTLAAAVILFGIPTLFLFSMRKVSEESASEVALRAANRFLYVLCAAALLCAVIGGYRLWTGYAMVRSGGAAIRLNAGGQPPAGFNYGLVELTGRVQLDRQGGLGARTWFSSTGARFSPILGEKQSGASVTYLVEVDQKGAAPVVGTVAGLLVRNGLRPDGIRLFEDNGYHLSDPHYVLFTKSTTVLRPYQMEALKWDLFALMLAMVAAYQRWRIRKIPPKRGGSAHMTR